MVKIKFSVLIFEILINIILCLLMTQYQASLRKLFVQDYSKTIQYFYLHLPQNMSMPSFYFFISSSFCLRASSASLLLPITTQATQLIKHTAFKAIVNKRALILSPVSSGCSLVKNMFPFFSIMARMPKNIIPQIIRHEQYMPQHFKKGFIFCLSSAYLWRDLLSSDSNQEA